MKYSKQLLLWAAVMSLTIPTIGYTADDDDDIIDETPSYTNAAQAMHASNLADAAARNPDTATEAAAGNLRDAREEYDSALEEDKEEAYNNLETARENYAGEIERLTGLASEDIYDMRDDGMGWGQIANELGVHPGTLGLGHTKKNRVDPAANDFEEYQNSNNEMTKATKRDTNQGWSKNHTTTSSKKNSKKGADLSADQPKNNGTGSDKNNSGSKSNNGKSQSSKSNNGKGNSKNK